EKGIVIFDSEGKAKGQDFSQWRDVYYTLKGQYGARSSDTDTKDPDSINVLHVAAPIYKDGKIFGVVTVRKPTEGIKKYIENAKHKYSFLAWGIPIFILSLGLLYSILLSKPFEKLTHYAREVRLGSRKPIPKFYQAEASELSQALESMRESLEGKKYIEKTLSHLTHELKSPLTSLMGAAELLENPPSEEARLKLLNNIQSESQRLKSIVERLLGLAALEAQRELDKQEEISLKNWLKPILESLKTKITQKSLRLENQIEEGLCIKGDPFLLETSLRNLLENAIDFSPPQSVLRVLGFQQDKKIIFKIQDQGPGIPDYAQTRVYEKFYSLPRPDTGKKSSGLGLSLVKEIIELHDSQIHLENLKEGGLEVTLIFHAV
ncbi:MAG: two-component system sensor histidine kinase CreC, partial [Deltaproteobacteria bacterium]|nr:two-component system sensor histidine kinase CreC [Deltaproteobacteria bacterium]